MCVCVYVCICVCVYAHANTPCLQAAGLSAEEQLQRVRLLIASPAAEPPQASEPPQAGLPAPEPGAALSRAQRADHPGGYALIATGLPAAGAAQEDEDDGDEYWTLLQNTNEDGDAPEPAG